MCGGARIKPLLGVFVFLNFCFFLRERAAVLQSIQMLRCGHTVGRTPFNFSLVPSGFPVQPRGVIP